MNEKSPPLVTIITPTTGKDSLFFLIESIKKQEVNVFHLLLWDDVKEGRFNSNEQYYLSPYDLNDSDTGSYTSMSIDIKSKMSFGLATGSALRSIGLMVAFTDWVTFADDDIVWEKDHLKDMLNNVNGKNWVYCKRNIWTESNGSYEYLGVDEFESVGEKAKTPYKMVDNNSMMFNRRFGVSASCLYRETKEYNDDRLMYSFLKEYAGDPGVTNQATVNQVCPKRLETFFRNNCTLDPNKKGDLNGC